MSTTTAMMWGALTRAAALPKMSSGAAVKALARMTAGTAVMVLALVMTMMMTACSTGDDGIADGPKPEQPGQPEQPAAQGTTVHVSVGAGIDAAGQTRSAVVMDGGKRSLRFSAAQGTPGEDGYVPADRLFIFGELNDGGTTKFLAGYLALVGEPTSDGKEATFSGNLKVYDNDGNESTYTFTNADPLSECSGLQAHLIAGGFYDDFFEVMSNYSPSYNYNHSLTTGDDRVNTLMTKGMAVVSETYSTADGFTDFQGDAILNCTISGLESEQEYSVKLLCTDDEDTYNNYKDDGNFDDYKQFDNKVTSSGAGVATFAIPIASPDCSDRYVSVALKIDDNYLIIPLGKITQTKNKVYNLSWDFNKVVDLAALNCDYEAQDGDILTGTLSGNYKITIPNGAKLRLCDVTINGVNNTDCKWAGITCKGDAEITLTGSNTVRGFYSIYPGIYVPKNKTLTIKGSGSLNASSNGSGAGIGSISYASCGNINITGGTITATGGFGSAGIGSGNTSSCGDITISGGTVTANGGGYAAGIGSGNTSSCGDITISGGTVTANGGGYAAGIGTGCGSEGNEVQGGEEGDPPTYDPSSPSTCGRITISGGTITATGGDRGAGIGTGYVGNCGDITISGGTGTATKGEGASHSIGRGDDGGFFDYSGEKVDFYVYIGGVSVGYIYDSPFTWPAP